MEFLDGTIISTAAPDMAASLHVRPVDVGVAMTAYLITVAVLIPSSGWAADRYGARRVFTRAVGLFTGASLLCAAATCLPGLVVMRVLQGAGGATMVPVGRLVVLRGTAEPDLLRAVAQLTWPGLVAPVPAPLLGGLFTTYGSWRCIFLVDVPLGVVAVALALRVVPDGPREPDRPPLDLVAFVLGGSGIAALVYGMELLGGQPPEWSLAGGATAAGRCCAPGVALAALALRAADPLSSLVGLRGSAAQYQMAFILLALLPLAAAAEAVRLAPDAGSAISGPGRGHPIGARGVFDRSARAACSTARRADARPPGPRYQHHRNRHRDIRGFHVHTRRSARSKRR
ncbi:MFS transporter [Streptomyces cynarae]|uniref:MFS transporter n=1 Tax=Streptomyces cynarae TaxID=2981134 RepID=UPI00406D1F14